MNSKETIALNNARADLCFAIDNMADYPGKDDPYVRRLFGTVQFITEVLDDAEEFKTLMKTWKMLCPDCTLFTHSPCKLHGILKTS